MHDRSRQRTVTLLVAAVVAAGVTAGTTVFGQATAPATPDGFRQTVAPVVTRNWRKLDEYLYAVRDVEKQIQSAERGNIARVPVDAPSASVPDDKWGDSTGRLEGLADL